MDDILLGGRRMIDKIFRIYDVLGECTNIALGFVLCMLIFPFFMVDKIFNFLKDKTCQKR